MSDDTPRKLGGARPGAGRPPGSKNKVAKPAGKRIGLYLDPAAAEMLERRAAEEQVTPYAWILRVVKRALGAEKNDSA